MPQENLGPYTGSPSCWLVGTVNQSIPDQTWTKVTFSTVTPKNYPSGFSAWRSATPTRLYYPFNGLVTEIWEVCWAPSATGVRALRVVNNNLTALPAEYVQANGCNVPAAAGAGQHMQICNNGEIQTITRTVSFYNELEVWQNSGGALNLIFDGAAAPQVMSWYTGY